jgi:prevent-host-death family protein
MKVIEASEAALRFGELLDQVEDGAEITIAQNGRPIARLLSPRPQDPQTTDLPAAIRRLQELAEVHAPRLDARELWDGGRRF